MILQRKDLNRAGLLTIHWIRQLPFTLLILFVFSFTTNQYFEWLARALNDSEQGPWPAQVGEFLISLIEGAALWMIGGYFLVNLFRKTTWKEFFKKTTLPLTAESLRSFTRIILWSLAFILPGVVVFCRLWFVPYIVFVDPTYTTQPDAVARSYALTKTNWLQITAIVMGLEILDGAFELIPNLLKIDDLVLRACIDLCGFLFSLFSFVLLYILFENLVKRYQEKGS